MVFPSGDQYDIAAAGYSAVVTESGAALRCLSHDGRDLVHGFAETEMSGGDRGQLLMPWPNRIRDGRYSFGGRDLQLGLSDPARGNASHGLARWAAWT
ncbi:MAG TPA: aldose epimerase, partial [Nocardioides sp.]